MTHRLGLHWIRVHPDQHDYAHIERMQYSSAKLFEWHWNNRDACRDLLAVLPRDAYILARDHPMSEQKGDMFADPEGTGTRHANEWAIKVATGNVHTPVERTFFLGINEPDATTGDRNAIDLYTAAFLNRLKVHGLRGGGFNFSTGHPRTVDGTGATQADYTVFERSHQAIVAGHHIGVLHIYGTAAVPCVPGHYDRLKACPWTDVTWIVGECGADEHVVGGGAHDGYLRTMGANESYCRWLDDFIAGVNDARIHSYQVFSYDFSHPWDSFDIRPIRAHLEAYRWQHATAASTTPPHTVHIPAVGTGGAPTTPAATVYVTAPNGLNLRAAPGDGDVLIAIPFGAAVTITGVANANSWLRASYQGHSGWIASAYVGVTPPQEPTTPPVTGDTWARSWPIVLKFEGGLSLDPNDTGNYYQDKLIGTKFGISARSWGGQYDIPNLTQAQALEIYHKHYWLATGCDRLPWPLCLIHFDTAVQHGTSVAILLLNAEPTPEEKYLGLRALRYTHDPKWRTYAVAWGLRVAHLHNIARGK